MEPEWLLEETLSHFVYDFVYDMVLDFMKKNTLDISYKKLYKQNKEFLENDDGTRILFVTPFGIPLRTTIDVYNIVRTCKHGIREIHTSNHITIRRNNQKNKYAKRRRNNGRVQFGHQEQINAIIPENSFLLNNIMDIDCIVFCKKCKIISSQSEYRSKVLECNSCLSIKNLRILQTCRSFIDTTNLLKSRGINMIRN